MNPVTILSVIALIILYCSINYYIGSKLKNIFGALTRGKGRIVYWILLWIAALSFILSTILHNFFPELFDYILAIIGVYWLGALEYFILIFLIIDIFILIKKIVKRKSTFYLIKKSENAFPWLNLMVAICVTGLMVYGTFHAQDTKLKRYDFSINKKVVKYNKLHIVAVSDIHLGNIVGSKRLSKMVDSINAQKPDIVFLVGDVIDNFIEPYNEHNMGQYFKKLKSKFGTYMVLGNHEYIGDEVNRIVKTLEKSNITVLRDNNIKIDNSFYVIGRDDLSCSEYGRKKRKNIDELIKGVDTSLPVILLDHQPRKLNEAVNKGIDLQISGHTHGGQIFPSQLVTKIVYELDYGYKKKGNTNIVVTSGYGTWGPPVRIGSDSEIVDINLTLKNK